MNGFTPLSTAQLSLLGHSVLASLIALALLWWLARGARRFSRARSLRQALARTGGVASSTLEAAFEQARQALQPGAARLRPQALYAQPWMLFLGDRRSRVSDLLEAAAAGSPVSHGVPGSFWRWWLLPRLVAIECDPRLVEPAGEDDAPGTRNLQANWYSALLSVAEHRGAQPLDAVALCVDAQSLMAGPQAAGELAARLRRRADEASQQLRLRLSTQVVVTGLDRLPGYAVVRAAIPDEVLGQVVGVRVQAGTLVVIDDALGQMSQRLDALRMALLREQDDAPGRLAVHEFFAHWQVIRPGLSAFLKRVFAPSSAPFRLRGRALYFVAAPAAADAQQPAFVADMFGRFFPMERAYPTR